MRDAGYTIQSMAERRGMAAHTPLVHKIANDSKIKQGIRIGGLQASKPEVDCLLAATA